MTLRLLPLLLLAACAGGEGAWPSLAPRPGEQPRAIVAAPAPPPGAPVPAETEARIGAQARAAEGALLTARSALDEALTRARRAPRGEETWVAAQLALSRFEAAASGVTEARLAAEAALADGKSSPMLSALIARLAASENDNVILATNAASSLGG